MSSRGDRGSLKDAMISVIIPLHNEAESLKELHRELRGVLTRVADQSEIWFIDDGSTDGSWAALEAIAAADLSVGLIQLRRRFGKAIAYAAGFRHAHGDIVATLDADLQDDPHELPKLLDALQAGHDVVVGWKKDRKDPRVKVISSHLFNAGLRRIAGTTLHDHNSGFRVLRREVTQALRLRGDLYRMIPAFAAMAGFRVTEVPVHHRARQHGKSKYGATGLRRSFRGIFDIIAIGVYARYAQRPFHFFAVCGGTLFATGVAINAYLSARWFAGENIGDRPLLLLGTLLIVLGVNFFSIGFLADLILGSTTHNEELPLRAVRSPKQ